MARIDLDQLRPHQTRIADTIYEAWNNGGTAVIYGGRGTLKTSTTVLCFYSILRLLSRSYTGLRYMVGALNYKQLREAFLDHWTEQVDSSRYEYNSQEQEITFTDPNSDVIIRLRHTGDSKEGIAAARAARSRQGGNIMGYYFPQAESVPQSFYEEFDTLTRAAPIKRPGLLVYPPYYLRMLDANPEGTNHWIYRHFVDPSSSTHNPRSHVLGIPTTPETSVYSAEWIAQKRLTWPAHRVARQLDAIWAGAEGQIYNIDDRIHVVSSLPAPSGRWALSMDWGFKDPFVCLLLYISDGSVYVRDCVDRTELTNEQLLPIVSEMLRRHGLRFSDLAGFTADTGGELGPRSISWWKQQTGLSFYRNSKRRLSGWIEITTYLNDYGANGRPRVTFHGDAMRCVESLRSLVWDERKEDAQPGDDHHADALRYALMSKLLRKREI